MICLMVPITIITCMCSREIVSIAYFRGSFNEHSLVLTSAALIGYAIGFTSSGVRDIVIRVLYSYKDTKGPMITGIFAVAANIFFSIVLSKFIGVMGISIASSICLTVNFLINSQMLKKHVPEYSIGKHLPTLCKQIPSTLVLVLIVFLIKNIFNSNVIVFALCAIVGLIAYFSVLTLMRISEISIVRDKIIDRIKNRG